MRLKEMGENETRGRKITSATITGKRQTRTITQGLSG